MSVRLTLLRQRDAAGRPLWQLDQDLRWNLGPGCWVTVPAGFVTNMATVPRFFWRLVSPTDLREAAIVHDYLVVETHPTQPANATAAGFSRWLADAVLYDVMVKIGVPAWRRWVVWYGVRFWSRFGVKR